MCRTKARGRFLLRDLAPAFPNFRRSGTVPRSQLLVTSELFGTCEQSPPLPVPRHHIRCKSFLVPSAAASCLGACVSLASVPLAGSLSDSLAGLVSDALPSSVAGSLPNLVPDSHPEFLLRPLRVTLPVLLEFLSRCSCEFRYRFSDGSCPLSPSGGLLLR